MTTIAKVTVQFVTGQEDRESEIFGPYDFVQQTYEDLRVGRDGENTLAQYDGGNWKTADGQWWSDFIVAPVMVQTDA